MRRRLADLARAALLVGLLASTMVSAQEAPEGSPTFEPPPPAPAVIPAPPLETGPVYPQELAWSQRCLTRPVGYYEAGYWEPRPRLGETIRVRLPSHGVARAGSSNSTGSSGGQTAALLVVAAVIVAAVMPFILYALDDDATPDVLGRFECPQVETDLRGGAEFDLRGGGLSSPFVARLRAGAGPIGVEAQIDWAPWAESRSLVNGLVAGVVRFTPKQHIEAGLSLGYRSLVLRGDWRPGLDLAIPHQYVFFRSGASQLGLEVRPGAFIWARGLDVSLDVGLRIPLGSYVSLHLGARVFSVDALQSAGAGVQAGVAFRL